ncbi:DUF7373 family lipoprotein [Nocardia goodfellowii]
MRPRYALCAAIAVMLAASTSCGSDDQPGAPAVDTAALDSGNYPVVPRDVETIRTSETGALLEAVRIGAVTPLPLQIDGKFSFQTLVSPERRLSANSLPIITSLTEADFREVAQGFIAGWDTNGKRRSQPNLGSAVELDILRFHEPAQAVAAARGLAERQSTKLPGQQVQIPDFPLAEAKYSESKKYLDTWLTHNALVLHVHIEDPVSEPVDITSLIDFTRRALAKKIEMLNSYSPTPADQLQALPIDTDGLLSRTLPVEPGQQRNGKDYSVVMPQQAAMHFETGPAQVLAALADAGVDIVAFSNARVYRARDAKSASRLAAALIAKDADGWQAIDSPPNLPTAKCFDTKDKKLNSGRYPPACFLTYDRYVARVTAKNTQELHQKAAAQYKLLAYRP